MADVAVTIIGGGVVGLAVGAELSTRYSPLYVLERNPKYGQETSARNSEVIHAGIYYAANSLKARLCVEGKQLLYELCEKHDIPHQRITKVITATTTMKSRSWEGSMRSAPGTALNCSSLRQRKYCVLNPTSPRWVVFSHLRRGLSAPTVSWTTSTMRSSQAGRRCRLIARWSASPNEAPDMKSPSKNMEDIHRSHPSGLSTPQA